MSRDGGSGHVNWRPRQDEGSGDASRSTDPTCDQIFSSDADSEDAGDFRGFPAT